MVWLLKWILISVINLSYAKENEIYFKTQKIKLGSVILSVEVADTAVKRERGLMFRTKLDPNKGMLFVFESEETRAFWMKNTFVDLAIGFFDKNKKLVDIIEMKAVKSEIEIPQTYPSRERSQYALEVNAQWFKKHKIPLGTRFEFLK